MVAEEEKTWSGATDSSDFLPAVVSNGVMNLPDALRELGSKLYGPIVDFSKLVETLGTSRERSVTRGVANLRSF